MTLKFNAKTHRYWIDGKPVKGVTTLIGDGIPKPALPRWAARTVAEWVADNDAELEVLRGMGRGPLIDALKGVPWQKRDEAAVRGTDVHTLGEELVHGREVDVPPHLIGHVQAYTRWLDEWQPVPVLTECSVANRSHWYAGRFDLIADMQGTRWLLDLKTSAGVYGETALQCDAYRNAEFYVTDDDPDTELPLPEGIERLGVIHIREDGADLVPLESNGQPFRDFLHAAWIAKRTDQIKGYTGTPLPTPAHALGGAA